MSLKLRILLLVSAVLAVWYIVRRIKKSQLQILDALFWLVVSFILIIFGIIPVVPISVARYFGVDSPVNFVYLIMIFILLLQCFLLSIRMSKLENRFSELVQELAVRKYIEERDDTK